MDLLSIICVMLMIYAWSASPLEACQDFYTYVKNMHPVMALYIISNLYVYVLYTQEWFLKPEIILDGHVITYVEHCKYPGTVVHLHSVALAIKRQMRTFYANIHMLLCKLSACSHKIKCQWFHSFCVNLYCPYFWCGRIKCLLKKLNICYNNGLRRLLNIPSRNCASDMFVNLNLLENY